MNGKSTGMVGEMIHDGVISGKSEYPKPNVSALGSCGATYSDLP